MVTELNKAVPANKRGTLDEAATMLPANLRLRTCLMFPLQSVKFRASPDYGGMPWYDFGWITVADNQEGAEINPMDPSSSRMLVKFWAFTRWKGQLYAFVTYFTKMQDRHPHPILVKYKHLHVTRYNRRTKSMKPVQPFYAVNVSSIISTAAVFRDPDYTGRDDAPDYQVLLHEPWVMLSGGRAGMLPSVDMLDVPPEAVTLPSMPQKKNKKSGEEKRGGDEVNDTDDELIDDDEEVEYEDECW